MGKAKETISKLLDLFDDNDDPGEVVYDPVHLAAAIVIAVFGLGVLFWTLWALLVCEGGIFPKVGPLLGAVFTSKTFADYGYRAFPYDLGVFDGWIVNLGGLVAALLIVAGLWRISEATKGKPGR